MDLDSHLRKVQMLSPKAAKIALRILDADLGIAVEQVLALRPALVERSSESAPFGTTDWMTIAAIERPGSAVTRLTPVSSARRAIAHRQISGSGRQASEVLPSGTSLVLCSWRSS